MDGDFKRHIEQFERLFDDCMHAIHLKRNMKFRNVRHYVIILTDVMQRAYRVREMVGDADTIDFIMYDNNDAPVVAELYKVEDESVFFHGADRILYGDECIEGECTGRFDDNILWCIIKNGVIVEASDDKKIGTRLAVKPNPVLAKVNKNTRVRL